MLSLVFAFAHSSPYVDKGEKNQVGGKSVLSVRTESVSLKI